VSGAVSNKFRIKGVNSINHVVVVVLDVGVLTICDGCDEKAAHLQPLQAIRPVSS
jgi:hypothetical protein